MKILGITESDWFGVIDALTSYCFEVTTPTKAIQRIIETDPDELYLGVFKPKWQPILDWAKAKGIKVTCMWYSGFVLNDFDALNRKWLVTAIAAYRRGFIESFGSPHEGFVASLKLGGIKASYRPCLFDPDEKVMPDPVKPEGLNIGIFGSGQPWKNMETQILAACLVPNAKVHVPVSVDPSLLYNLGLENRIVWHPTFKFKSDFYNLLGSMTINMVVSMSETFSYLAVESVLMNTPVLVSSIVPIYKDFNLPPVLRHCVTPYFDDPRAIANKIHSILNNYKEIQKTGKEYVRSQLKSDWERYS